MEVQLTRDMSTQRVQNLPKLFSGLWNEGAKGRSGGASFLNPPSPARQPSSSAPQGLAGSTPLPSPASDKHR